MGRQSIRRWIGRLCLALLVLEVAYLIGANSFLRSSWGRAVLNRRESIALDWERAWTMFPGIVSVRGLELAGNARGATWRTTVESGRMVIWLPSLLRRHFRLLSATGAKSTVEVDIHPASDAPRARKRGRGWRVSLEGLSIEPLVALRVNEHRLAGAGRLRGSARFEVRGPTELDLGEIVYTGARLDTGGEVAADSVELNGWLSIAPFVVGDDLVGDILAGTSGELTLDAQASGLGFLEAYLSRVPWLKLGGQGHLTADLQVTDGWLAPGSRLDLVGPTVSAAFFDLEARGKGELHGVVPEGAGNTRLDLQLEEFAVARPSDNARLVEGTGLHMRITNDSIAIDRPAEGIALEIDLPEAAIPDFAAFSPYLPPASGLEITGGSGVMGASLRYRAAERTGEGSFDLRGDDVQAAFGDVRLRSKVELNAKLEEMSLDDGHLELGGSRLSIDDTETWKEDRLSDSGWWGRLEMSPGSWARDEEEPGAPGVLSGLLSLELRDTGPVVALLERYAPRLAWFDGLMTVHDVTASARVRSQGARLRFNELTMTGGEHQRLEILGELELAEKNPSGVFFAKWGPLTAAVALEEGSRDWKLTGSRKWYDSQAPVYRGRMQTPVAAPVEAKASGE